MAKSVFTNELPNREGWYWARYFRNNNPKPIILCFRVVSDRGRLVADVGEYYEAVEDLKSYEFCYIEPQPETIDA